MISAWAKGGNIPDAIVRLQATPASVTPQFSFGCGSYDGTASCDLGAMDAKSVERQLEVKATVPTTASTVKSVRLVVIGSAADLSKDPKAAAAVTIKGTASVTTPTPSTSPLPIGSLPGVSTTNPTDGSTLSPGGNASGLFPTLKPSRTPSPSPSASLSAKARKAANTSALPEGAPIAGAQLAGLAALAVAFILAVTRVSIRRRPAPGRAAAAAAAPPTPESSKSSNPTAEPAAAQATSTEPSDASPKPTEAAAGAESTEAPQDPASPSDHATAEASDEAPASPSADEQSDPNV